MKKHLLAIIFLFSFSLLNAQRITRPFNEGWKFSLDPLANETSSTASWKDVTLPHTWNDRDAQDVVRKPGEEKSVSTYLRTCGWYANKIDVPAEWKNRKRTFVRFEAASIVATVYLNGRIIGEHKGAFTAFCLELTDDLKYDAENELRVEVDNRWRADVPPISGGFAIFGGLYRPAQIIVTDLLCISPLSNASPGVIIDSDEDQWVTVYTSTSYGKYSNGKMDVSVPKTIGSICISLLDADGETVAREEIQDTIFSGDNAPKVARLEVPAPHLWQGIEDPYLYTARVELLEGDTLRDVVCQKFGIRDIQLTQENGITLNGKPYPIYGVSRHQDLRDKGWALTYEDDLRDMEMMKEMGVTAIRMAHYPQSEQIHQIADSMGFLVWDEISLVNEVRNAPGFIENTMHFFSEMLDQLHNHPSIAWWGLFNEIDHPETDYPMTIFDVLNYTASFDDMRLTTSASNKGNRYYDGMTDAPAWNNYPGWYWMLRWPYEENNKGRVEGFGEWMDYRSNEIGGRRFALSEYGAGGNIEHHMDTPLPEQMMKTMNSPYHPEEWQCYVHEEDWRTILHHKDQLWGSFVWAMFDFIVPGWSEGGLDNINTKGLVTHDRQTRKDVFYFYKANWNPEPMLYIASRRFTERKQKVTDIKVYTNCAETTLYVNGKKVSTAPADEIHVCRFKDVQLKEGRNVIEVKGRNGKTRLTDRCEWNVSL